MAAGQREQARQFIESGAAQHAAKCGDRPRPVADNPGAEPVERRLRRKGEPHQRHDGAPANRGLETLASRGLVALASRGLVTPASRGLVANSRSSRVHSVFAASNPAPVT